MRILVKIFNYVMDLLDYKKLSKSKFVLLPDGY